MTRSDIRYTRSGPVSVAYQVIGDATPDLVFVTGFVSNLAYAWEHPVVVRFYERVSAFSRLIRFDRRGTGLSDRPRDVPTLEARMDDLRVVMDAAGSERAAVLATFEAAAMATLFAATYPERVGALVLFNPYAKAVRSDDYPWGKTPDEWRHDLAEIERGWGSTEYFDTVLERSYEPLAHDESWRRWFVNMMRYGASPGAALTVHRMAMEIDIRDVLPAVRVPTLILHGPRNSGHATYMAERIPGAQRIELAGGDMSTWLVEDLPDRTCHFVRECWGEEEHDSVLTTVLFTDIVRSTERAVAEGDRTWAKTLGEHHALVRGHLDRFRGRELDTAGDGFFATFDGPVRAIRCADTITRALGERGIEIRAGIHTGVCEVVGDKVAGLAVNIGARVASNAHAGEILVSQTVKDLVAGSGLAFQDRGAATLKGVPGEWRLYALSEPAVTGS